MILTKKIPSYLIPKFQQGGLVFRDNLYTQPNDLGRVSNILITPRSQGYEETNNTLHNIQQERQLRSAEMQNKNEVVNSIIRNKIQTDEVEMKKKQYEDANLRYILKERADYVDKLTGDDLDPIFNPKIKVLQEKHGIAKDRPLTMDGLAEQQKAIFAYYSDPEYKNIKEYSTLIKHVSTEAEKVNATLNNYKLKDPKGFMDYNLNDYGNKLRTLRQNLIQIGDGDFTKDGVLDQNDMNILKNSYSELTNMNIELTPQAQKRINYERDVEMQTQEATLQIQQLKNRKTTIDVKLAEEQMKALEDFTKVISDPNSTDDDKIRAKDILAAANKKIKDISGFDQSSGEAPKNESELLYRAGQGDPAAIKALQWKQAAEVQLKSTPTYSNSRSSSNNDFNYNTDGSGKSYKSNKSGDKIYNGYALDKDGRFKYGKYGPNGTEITANKIGIDKGIVYNEDGKLAFSKSDSEIIELFGLNESWFSGDEADIKEQIPGAEKVNGVWLIPPTQSANFEVPNESSDATSRGGKTYNNIVDEKINLVMNALEGI